MNDDEAVGDSLLGWYIFVTNFTTGALLGYSSVKSMVSLKVPPSHGLSSGLRRGGENFSRSLLTQNGKSLTLSQNKDDFCEMASEPHNLQIPRVMPGAT